MALRSVPLEGIHARAGARMVEFAGWLLPLQYGSIIREVQAVRTAAGLFDVSHMGRLDIFGAGPALQRLLTNDLAALRDGQCQYTLMCRPDGGVIDDLIVCRASAERFGLVVNAANRAKDVSWLAEHLAGSAKVDDRTESTCMLALQGPVSAELLAKAGMPEAGGMGRFRWASGSLAGREVTVSRTGYTGEDGFEITCANLGAEAVWSGLGRVGESFGLIPCGLAARDVLRIEAGLPLYGHEIGENINPIEAGLARWVKPDRADFTGREAIARMIRDGPRRKLVGVRMEGRAIPRAGDTVTAEAGDGTITSGTFSPTLGVGIGMAYMPPAVVEGDRVEVAVHSRPQPGRIQRLPFVTAKGAPSPLAGECHGEGDTDG